MALAHRGLKNAGNMEAALSQRGAHFHVASLCTEASGRRSMRARPVWLRATMLTLCPAAARALAIFSTRTSHGYSSSQTWQTESGRVCLGANGATGSPTAAQATQT